MKANIYGEMWIYFFLSYNGGELYKKNFCSYNLGENLLTVIRTLIILMAFWTRLSFLATVQESMGASPRSEFPAQEFFVADDIEAVYHAELQEQLKRCLTETCFHHRVSLYQSAFMSFIFCIPEDFDLKKGFSGDKFSKEWKMLEDFWTAK